MFGRNKEERPRKRRRWLILSGVSAGFGAALAYLFDPDRGRGRRAKAASRMGGMVRRTGRRFGRVGRRVGAQTYGVRQKIRHRGPDAPPPNDATLAQKVQTLIFQDADVPDGRINVTAERGTVVLHGTVDSPRMIRKLEKQVRKIPGVRDVRNNLHLPGQPAPNKVGAT